MNITAGIFTHNAIRFERVEVLKRTVQSLKREADRLFIIDNGSTDGTESLVEEMGGICTSHGDGNTTAGRGMNTVHAMAGRFRDSQILVCSNDDMDWRVGWAARLRRAWSSAPADMLVLSGFLQPIYPWDEPLRAIDCGGETVVERTSATGAGWTLLAKSLPLIGRFVERPGQDDVPKSRELREAGYRLGSIDLADHLGQDCSTWQVWRPGGDIRKWLAQQQPESSTL